MEGRQERDEPLDRAYDLSSLSSEVEAVARGDRSMQQCLQATFARYPDSTVASPHLFQKVAVPGICVDRWLIGATPRPLL
jgi:hypothetical protein